MKYHDHRFEVSPDYSPYHCSYFLEHKWQAQGEVEKGGGAIHHVEVPTPNKSPLP